MARLDSELIIRKIARSRERAKELVKSDKIKVNGTVINKPSFEVTADDEIEALAPDLKYVGRGALKLEKAAEAFEICFDGKTCLDIGASTGGFTDFMLRNGAAKVFAVDVGHGQLAQELIADSRVINAEGVDIRDVSAEFLGGQVDFISADVSFISLKKILAKIYELLKPNASAALLIKPQFETNRSNIGKHGIVKDHFEHKRILAELDAFAVELGFFPEKYIYSPIKGGSGNIEYLVKLVKKNHKPEYHDFKSLVESAFKQL